MSKDLKQTINIDVETMENFEYIYTVFYSKKIRNGKYQHNHKFFKTYNAAKEFKTNCILNPKVYTAYIIKSKAISTCKKCKYYNTDINNTPCFKCNENYSMFTASETF